MNRCQHSEHHKGKARQRHRVTPRTIVTVPNNQSKIAGERRENKLIKLPDSSFLNEDGAGQQVQHQSMYGKVSVNEAFLQLGLAA